MQIILLYLFPMWIGCTSIPVLTWQLFRTGLEPTKEFTLVISQESHILMGSFSGRTAWPNFGQIVILHKCRHHAAERGRTCASLQFAHCHAIREEQVVTSTL